MPGSSRSIARILVVDDNRSIHRDFRLVLLDELQNPDLQAEEQRLFAARARATAAPAGYELEDAFSGQEAIEKVQQSLAEERPYQVAFVDIRMPGMDGVETIGRLWQLDPRIQVVICTAYSDYSWSDLAQRLGPTDKLLVLKKPFDNIEVTQLASTLTEKWHLAIEANLKLEQMELLVAQRTQKLLELLRRQEPATASPLSPASPPGAPATGNHPATADDAGAVADTPVALVLEDDAAVAQSMSQALAPDYHVTVASNGDQAFQTAQEIVPDIVIAEITGSNIDGIALCRRLKADELASHIPILMLGAPGLEDSHIKALEAGADDCLGKPFTVPLLKARVDHLVRAQRKPLEPPPPAALLQPREVAANQVDAQFLRRAIHTAERFLSDFEFDVDVLARKMGMSRRQLFRKLKAVAGCTPNSFIRTLRLNRAAHLLLHSQMTVTEITYAVGFADLKHFRSLFRDCFGVLPGDYPQRHQRREVQD